MATTPTSNSLTYTSEHGGCEWLVKNHIIRAWVDGRWTKESAEFFNTHFTEMIESSPAEQVHVLFDTADMTTVMITPRAAVNYLAYLRLDKTGKAILHSVSLPLRAIVGLLINVLNANDGKVLLMDNEDEAIDKLREIDPKAFETSR